MIKYSRQIVHTQIFSVLNVVIGFFSVLILTKFMAVSEYGEYVLLLGFISFGSLFFSQNLYSYTRLHIPGASLTDQYGYLKTVLAINISTYFIIMTMLIVFGLDIYLWYFFELNLSLRYYVLVMLGLKLINLELTRFFIATKRISLNNYFQFIQKNLILLSVVILAYCNHLQLEPYLGIYIVIQFITFLFLVRFINISEFTVSKLKKDVISRGYSIALPLLPVGLMSIALNYTDTLMIAKFVDIEHVAQYGFASQIISIVMMVVGTSIVLILFPYATEAHNGNNIEKRTFYFAEMFHLGISFALIFYLLSYINSEWVISFFWNEKYGEVSKYLKLLSLFPLFHLIYSVSSHHLQLVNIIKTQVLFALIVIAENIILNYVFITSFGVIGAATASLISYITLAFIYTFRSINNDIDLRKRIISCKKKKYSFMLIFIIILLVIGNIDILDNYYVILMENILLIFGLYIFVLKKMKDIKSSNRVM